MSEALNDVPQAGDAEPEYDLIYAFFQNCYHMKDWLVNSDAAVPREEVEAYIEAHTELQICADICNGTKHYRQRRHRVTDRFLIGIEYVPGDIAGTEPPGGSSIS